MAVKKNPYYSSLIDDFFKGKDSSMEMAKIVSFDPERLVARVYTLTSMQFRDNVPVFFPSMYLNTGIISPPAIDSISLLFWGPDRQPFILPIQMTVPNITVKNNLTEVNASPGFFDEMLSLKNIQGGEHLIRSLGGAYLFLKNIGDVELGNSRLQRLALTGKDGALHTSVERVKGAIGSNRLYFGPISKDSNLDPRTHFTLDLEEVSDETLQIPMMDDNTLLDKVLNDELDTITLTPAPKILTVQYGHVLDGNGQIEKDGTDFTELFTKQVFTKGDVTRIEQVSKGGRRVIKTTKGLVDTEVSISASEVKVQHTRMIDGLPNITHIGINPNGQIVCGKNGKEYDLMPLLEWFYEER